MLADIIFHEVAMLYLHGIPFCRQPVIDVFGRKDTAVHAASAAHGNNQLTLSLFDILRHQKVEHPIQVFQKLLRYRPFGNVFGNLGNRATLVAHGFNIEGIRQEPHIQDQIRIERHAELEPKRQHIDAHLLAFIRSEQAVNLIPQLNFLEL